jgi:FG-GAP repeat protein
MKNISAPVSVGLPLLMLFMTHSVAAPVQQAYIKASNTGSPDYFGFSVAISGDTLVVGAYGEDSAASGVNGDQNDNSCPQAGAAYVLVRTGTNWSQQAYIKASNPRTNASFGWSVAVSGDTLVVGAPDEDSNAIGVNGSSSTHTATNSGAAYIFARSGTNWLQQAYLKAPLAVTNSSFGLSVAISGDTVVVGAAYEDYIGSAYVFVREGTNWSLQLRLRGSNTEFFDWFGHSVAISGDTVLVGASGEDSNATGVNGNQTNNTVVQSGAAYVFVRKGTNWSQQAYLKASNPAIGDQFGFSAALSEDTAVIAALGKAIMGGDDAGAAYVFARKGTNWAQQAYLTASNPGAGDQFGWSVAISADAIVVGAPFEDSNATGINGNQSDNTGYESGAAYVFVRRGTNWSQQAYVKASNSLGAPEPNLVAANFGLSAAISGETALVGAWLEASNATGVNGDGTNTGAGGSGAAYAFSGVGVGPKISMAPDVGGGFLVHFNGAPFCSYSFQRAQQPTGPWDTIHTSTAPLSGLIEFHDDSLPPGQGFYRTVQP